MKGMIDKSLLQSYQCFFYSEDHIQVHYSIETHSGNLLC